MYYLKERLKSFTISLAALLFVVTFSLSSCGNSATQGTDEYGSGATEENVEATDHDHSDKAAADSTATKEEHPAGEHPAGEEHPTGEKDSTGT